MRRLALALCCAVISLALVPGAVPAASLSADTIIVNGKILTGDAHFSIREALAVRDGKIVAVGKTADMTAFRGPQTRVIDLHGRTVIPGLIDSHMHALRAGLSFTTEVNWIGTTSLAEALERIHAAALAKPGGWIIVAGGWTESQFREKRSPTVAELVAAAPANPVYVQLFYSQIIMTPMAMTTLKITGDSDMPAGAKLDRDAAGNLTGVIHGDILGISGVFSKLPAPTYDQQVAGTKAFFRELNRLGMTGVVDPGGFNVSAASYAPLFALWHAHQLTMRVAYSLSAFKANTELADFQAATQFLPMGFGDRMLHFNGIGEIVTAGLYNNDNSTPAQQEQFFQVARWAASRGMALRVHWQHDAAVPTLLTIFERVNAEIPIGHLHWIVDHLNDASVPNLQRMQKLGVGWAVQDAMYFQGEQMIKDEGLAQARRVPPVETGLKIGVKIGAGTDAHRVMTYNPFVCLQWLLDGTTVAGLKLRGPEETPNRETALRLYTSGSAWFSSDESWRGTLTVGKAADFAVLSQDYMTVPISQIGKTVSLLTVVGGRTVYAAAPF
jgi:predicted amidohydrolase YtcJ